MGRNSEGMRDDSIANLVYAQNAAVGRSSRRAWAIRMRWRAPSATAHQGDCVFSRSPDLLIFVKTQLIKGMNDAASFVQDLAMSIHAGCWYDVPREMR